MSATLPALSNVSEHPRPRAIPPLRVLFALPGFHRVNRGAEVALESVAQRLATGIISNGQEIRHDITLIGSGPHIPGRAYAYRRLPCTPRERFISFPRFPYLRSHYDYEELSFARSLVTAFDPADFDVTVTCGYPYSNWTLRRAASPGQRPKHIFVTQNGDWMARALNWEYRHFNCDGLVCTNQEYFERHAVRYRCALIPNGVDPVLFHPGPSERARFGLPESVPVILVVSALIPSKRVRAAVQAVAALPHAFLAIAGNGECRPEVAQAAAELLPGRHALLDLPRSEMPALYRSASAFLHMSQDEPSANAYIEALATGLPIVTHDRAVTRWTFDGHAHLTNTSDLSAVTAALSRALAPDAAAAAARRELALSRYSWNEIAADYGRFIADVAA